MKKLMVMLAIVASGVAVNAASVDWKLSTGATYAGQNVYAIANTDAAKILAACASTTATDWTAIVDGIAAATASAGSRGYAASTTTGIAANDTLAFLIVDGTIAEGSNYTVLNATASYRLHPNITIYAKGDNLTAERYQTYMGFPMPKATFMGGVSIDL